MKNAARRPARAELPPRAGIGLRAPHYREILETRPDIGWVEVHSENYFGRGGQLLHYLERARCHYPLSLHGVGLSLGSANGLRQAHLVQLKALVERFEPSLLSDHLCWRAIGERHLNDLLPLPYTEAALDAVCVNVVRAQNFLGWQILVENVSGYLQFSDSTIPEWEFVGEVARRTGCGLLLDINDVYVSAVNHGFDALRYLDAIPVHAVREIHLATFDSNDTYLSTHGKPVAGLADEYIRRNHSHSGDFRRTVGHSGKGIGDAGSLMDRQSKGLGAAKQGFDVDQGRAPPPLEIPSAVPI